MIKIYICKLKAIHPQYLYELFKSACIYHVLTSSCCLQKVFEKNSAVKTHEKRVATRYPRGLAVVIPANKGKYPKPYINIETRAINTEIERPQIFQ